MLLNKEKEALCEEFRDVAEEIRRELRGFAEKTASKSGLVEIDRVSEGIRLRLDSLCTTEPELVAALVADTATRELDLAVATLFEAVTMGATLRLSTGEHGIHGVIIRPCTARSASRVLAHEAPELSTVLVWLAHRWRMPPEQFHEYRCASLSRTALGAMQPCDCASSKKAATT